jgi:hypothetical protein
MSKNKSNNELESWEANSQLTAGFDEVSREQLDKIKARTMYNMVEPIDGGAKKILFLTNKQALLLAKEPNSLTKMLDRLEVGRPQLVINILESAGSSEWYNCWEEKVFDGWRGVDWAAGCKTTKPAYLSSENLLATEGKIDTFMCDVLLPLAAETNAVVICNAIPAMCMLSSSFLRMYASKRATWGEKSPFTVLSVTNDMNSMYTNADAPCKHI